MTDSTAGVRQMVTFHRRYHESIVAGSKRVTVRWNEDIQIGPACFVFEPDDHPALDGEVIRVDLCEYEDLTPAAVHEPSTTDMVEYLTALRRRYYSDMPSRPQLQIVRFRLAGDQ